jgi:hypothetical protein
MSQVQLEAFFLVQNACTAFPFTLVSMLELSPPLRVTGLSGLNTIIVRLSHVHVFQYHGTSSVSPTVVSTTGVQMPTLAMGIYL